MVEVNQGSSSVTYNYDSIGRLTGKDFSGSYEYGLNFIYKSGANNSSTNLVRSLHYGPEEDDCYHYTYDENGNILTIFAEFDEGEDPPLLRYYYDELNQLIRENNQNLNRTIVYNYDDGGNILSKVEYPFTTGSNLGAPIDNIEYEYAAESLETFELCLDGEEEYWFRLGDGTSWTGYYHTSEICASQLEYEFELLYGAGTVSVQETATLTFIITFDPAVSPSGLIADFGYHTEPYLICINEYSADAWRDQMVSYDGNTITYDEIGNPLSDGTFNYTCYE